MRAAILGAGVIGAGWLARLIENGIDCTVVDPDPDAARKIAAVLDNADRAYAKLSMAPRRPLGSWQIAHLADAVGDADLIVEAVPERLDVKRAVYAEIEAAGGGGVIASSTSGFKPSDLQMGMSNPERLIVAHPFNPVYLLPLVEIVPGAATSSETTAWAKRFYSEIGMHPLVLEKEIDAFVADRLMEALWREALWLVNDGIATTEQIDDAIRFGCGLRWAQMGTFQTFHIAGGEGGMAHFMAQFGPALKWPWTKLMDVPDLTPELIDTIAGQSDAQADGKSPRELERIRDDNLVAILQALKAQDWGAGATLGEYEKSLYGAVKLPLPDPSKPLITVERTVPPDWTDYNGHMNESRYGQLYSDAADSVMRMIGADQEYVAAGKSYFTVDIRIKFIDEAHAGDAVSVETQVLIGESKKLKLFHRLVHADGRLLSTGEQFLLHVDLSSRRSVPVEGVVAAALKDLADAQSSLEWPKGVDR